MELCNIKRSGGNFAVSFSSYALMIDFHNLEYFTNNVDFSKDIASNQVVSVSIHFYITQNFYILASKFMLNLFV